MSMSQPGTDVVPENYLSGMMTGLEDFTAEDLKLARLVIDQKRGVFKDSLSGMEYEKVHAITLGVVKQRVMWQPTVEEDSSPLCKSTDFSVGYPTTWLKPSDNFPWKASGWESSDFQPDEAGRVALPCNNCRFTQWKSHPDGKKPWCSTQHAVPILYAEPGVDPYIQAVFTMQRSSLQASQAYFAGFMSKRMPAFSAKCEITLNKLKRGQNDYYVPALRVVEQVSQDRWPELSENLRVMRDFLTQPPLTRDENGEIVASSIASSNTIQTQSNQFQTNTWTPQVPVQQAASAAQPVVAQPVVAQPVVAQPVVAQPVVATPVTQPQVALPVSPPLQVPDDMDDLPF